MWSVTLVVLYQLLKAEILFTIVAISSGNSIADKLPRFYLRPLIDLVTMRDLMEQNALVTPALWAMLLAAVCFTTTGLGLLLRINWTRLIAIVMTGVEMIWLAYVVLMPAYVQQTPLSLPRQVFLALVLFLDALVIYLLVRNARAFENGE